MKMNSKILTVAVVAMFCATAFAVAAAEDDGASDKTYRLYIEVIDGKGNTVYSKWISETSGASVKEYIAAMNADYSKAITEAGLKSLGNVQKYYVDDSWGGVTFNYDTEYVYAATYYAKDGKWAEVTDMSNNYVDSSSAAIVLCPVDSFYNFFYLEKLPVGADANNYLKGDYGFMYLPDQAPNGFESPVMLYAIIALVIIVIIALILVVVKSKKKKTV